MNSNNILWYLGNGILDNWEWDNFLFLMLEFSVLYSFSPSPWPVCPELKNICLRKMGEDGKWDICFAMNHWLYFFLLALVSNDK